MQKSVVWLAVLAVSLALVACGGDDDDGDDGATTAETLTTEEWVAQADQICEQGDQEQNEEARAYFEEQGIDPETLESESPEVEDFIGAVVVPNIEAQIDEVDALPPPEGGEGQVQEFLDQANSDLDALAEDPSLGAGQSNPFAETNALAEDLGLKVCAS